MEKTCVVCKTNFSINKSPSLCTRETCSEKCRLELVSRKLSGRLNKNKQNTKNTEKWETVTCKNCAKIFTAHILYHRKFCSIKCKGTWQKENLLADKNPNWKNEKRKYSNVRRSVRNKLLRDIGKCENCGSDINLQVHHMDRNRSNNSKENIVLLCKTCHSNYHKSKGELDIARLILAHPQTKYK